MSATTQLIPFLIVSLIPSVSETSMKIWLYHFAVVKEITLGSEWKFSNNFHECNIYSGSSVYQRVKYTVNFRSQTGG